LIVMVGENNGRPGQDVEIDPVIDTATPPLSFAPRLTFAMRRCTQLLKSSFPRQVTWTHGPPLSSSLPPPLRSFDPCRPSFQFLLSHRRISAQSIWPFIHIPRSRSPWAMITYYCVRSRFHSHLHVLPPPRLHFSCYHLSLVSRLDYSPLPRMVHCVSFVTITTHSSSCVAQMLSLWRLLTPPRDVQWTGAL
jgi:hypothetical protein